MPQWSCPCGRLAVQPKGWMTWRRGRSCWSWGAATSRMWKVLLPYFHCIIIVFCPAAWCSWCHATLASSKGCTHQSCTKQNAGHTCRLDAMYACKRAPLLCVGSASCCSCSVPIPAQSPSCSVPNPAQSPSCSVPIPAQSPSCSVPICALFSSCSVPISAPSSLHCHCLC